MALTQTMVKVQNISKDENGHPTDLFGTEQIVTYKAFLYLTDRYKLLFQCDELGNEIPGNPNLHPEYRTAIKEKVVAPADDVRVKVAQEQKPAVKRGRKPKAKVDQEQIEQTA